jgi:hypothetical protein
MRRFLAALLALALGGCASAPGGAGKKATNEAYVLGMADAVKQLYWAKQALEAPNGSRPAGRVEYYTWEDSGTAQDGRRLAPEEVSVPVFIPAPAPSGGRNP